MPKQQQARWDVNLACYLLDLTHLNIRGVRAHFLFVLVDSVPCDIAFSFRKRGGACFIARRQQGLQQG